MIILPIHAYKIPKVQHYLPVFVKLKKPFGACLTDSAVLPGLGALKPKSKPPGAGLAALLPPLTEGTYLAAGADCLDVLTVP